MNVLQCGSINPSSTLSYVTASISAVLSLITIPGNLLICMAVYLDPYRRLRTPFNIVVANLAFADLIVGCITEPLSVYLHIKEGLGRKITMVEIRSLHLSYFISCTASVLSISLLALERYMSITYSFKYRLYFKVRRFVVVSLVVWLVAIGLSSVYILTSYVFYTFVFINIAVFWTLGVTTFCYVKILRKLKKVEKDRARESTVISNADVVIENNIPEVKASVISSNKDIASCEIADEEEGTNSNNSNVVITNPTRESTNNLKNSPYPQREAISNPSTTCAAAPSSSNEFTTNKYNILVTKTYIIVSVVFLACYIPALMIIYTMNWCSTCSCFAIHIMRDLQFIVVIVNSSVNPFLYAIRFAHFRRAICKLLQLMRDEVFY